MKEYFEYTDFNDVQDDIVSLTNIAKIISDATSSFAKKTYALNDFPYIQEVDYIEKQLLNISNNVGVPIGFVYKEWLPTPTSYALKNFSWSDFQRWLNNIRFLELYMNSLEVRYCGDGYCGEAIWL